MTKHYIDIVGKWAFIFAYDIGENDLGEIGDWLEALGARSKDIYRAQDVLTRYDTGLTYSSESLRMSVMCIGNATSEGEWWNTTAHEVDHLRNAISDYYDVEHGSESSAYLQGYIMHRIVLALKKDGYSFKR